MPGTYTDDVIVALLSDFDGAFLRGLRNSTSAWCGGLLVLDDFDCAFDQARFLFRL